MTPAGPGRHCAACAKVVVDFTQQTDAEILAYLARAVGTPCGRFRAAQLGRSLQPPARASRWRTWLGALLAAGSLGTGLVPKAAAQHHLSGSAGPLPVAPLSRGPALATPSGSGETGAPAVGVALVSPLPGGPPTVRGVVRDATTHALLPGVTVLLKGTTQGTSTTAAGEFALPVAHLPVQLVLSFIGYENVERTVGAAELAQPLEVLLPTDSRMLSGEMVITYAAQPPWPWRPRALYNWSKFWLTRPFRH